MQASFEQSQEDFCSSFSNDDWSLIGSLTDSPLVAPAPVATDFALVPASQAADAATMHRPDNWPDAMNLKRQASQSIDEAASVSASTASGGDSVPKKKKKKTKAGNVGTADGGDLSGSLGADNDDDDSVSSSGGADSRHNQRFTEQQRAALESVYSAAKYQTPADRAKLASRLGVAANRVAAWFQRRRWRDRRRLNLQGRLPDWVPPPSKKSLNNAKKAAAAAAAAAAAPNSTAADAAPMLTGVQDPALAPPPLPPPPPPQPTLPQMVGAASPALMPHQHQHQYSALQMDGYPPGHGVVIQHQQQQPPPPPPAARVALPPIATLLSLWQ